MATVFRNPRYRRRHLELLYLDFSTTPMCPELSCKIPTKYGNDRSNSKQMATVFEIQHGGGRHPQFFQICISNVTDVF